jgi:hypothetical protein
LLAEEKMEELDTESRNMATMQISTGMKLWVLILNIQHSFFF